jgi:hypothetical protein
MGCIFWYSTSSQSIGSHPALLQFFLPAKSDTVCLFYPSGISDVEHCVSGCKQDLWQARSEIMVYITLLSTSHWLNCHPVRTILLKHLFGLVSVNCTDFPYHTQNTASAAALRACSQSFPDTVVTSIDFICFNNLLINICYPRRKSAVPTPPSTRNHSRHFNRLRNQTLGRNSVRVHLDYNLGRAHRAYRQYDYRCATQAIYFARAVTWHPRGCKLVIQ